MDIQLEKKKGIQKKHIPYIAGGAVVLFLLIWIIRGSCRTVSADLDYLRQPRINLAHRWRCAQHRRRDLRRI